jgi:hypothetical protein
MEAPALGLIALIASSAFLVLCLMCAWRLATVLAEEVCLRNGRNRGLYWCWKAACLLASLVPTSAVTFILAVLVYITIGDSVTSGGAGLVLAVAIGVVGNHIDRQVSSGWTYYWEKIHDSLRGALPPIRRTVDGIPQCQRSFYNTRHLLILNSVDRVGRESTVLNILDGSVCTRRRPCRGHGGCLPTEIRESKDYRSA